MRWKSICLLLALVVALGSACHDDNGVLIPPEIDPVGEYMVTTTVVSNTCVESYPCEPICRLWWLAITDELQPLYIGRYGDDLVGCPLGPFNESRIVGGFYDDGTFVYESDSDVIVSDPEPGCRVEMRWSSTLTFVDGAFTGEAIYDLVVVDGDPAVCASASQHFATLPCRTRYAFDAVGCDDCTPAECLVG